MNNIPTTVSVRMSTEEHTIIKEKAKMANMSMNEYFKHCAMGKSDSGSLDKCRIGEALCSLYLTIEKVKNDSQKSELMEGANRIWRVLG